MSNNNNNNNKPKTQAVLEELFTKAINTLVNDVTGRSISEIKVQIDTNSGELQIYDDRETPVEKNIIFDWANRAVKDDSSTRRQVGAIRTAFIELKRKKIFETPLISKPFNVFLTDENFLEIEKIFTVEDPEFGYEGRLMPNLERELNTFYKQLFAGVE
jgi:hypothetical protein